MTCIIKADNYSLNPPIRCKRLRHDDNSKFTETLKNLNISEPTAKKTKTTKNKLFLSVSQQEIDSFFSLFDDDTVIQEFLMLDACYRVSDNHLLAMVLAYFKRARFLTKDYTNENFFVALYLANDMEEDEEDFKYEIFPWALGKCWRDLYPGFLALRDKMWVRMKFRAAVSRKCCEEVMRLNPDHYIWQRKRNISHGGAIRSHLKSSYENEPFPRGPDRSPIPCLFCNKPNNSSGYHSDLGDSKITENDENLDEECILSSTDSSPEEYFFQKPTKNTHIKFVKSSKNQDRNTGKKLKRALLNITNQSGQKAQLTKISGSSDEESSFDMEELWENLY